MTKKTKKTVATSKYIVVSNGVPIQILYKYNSKSPNESEWSEAVDLNSDTLEQPEYYFLTKAHEFNSKKEAEKARCVVRDICASENRTTSEFQDPSFIVIKAKFEKMTLFSYPEIPER